jgi:hypothetical protein
MIDDDVITRLVDLHDHIKAPDTPPAADVFRGERMLRRRRKVVFGAAAAAVVALLGVTAVTTGGQRAGDRFDPVQPAPTPTEDAEWPLERIRAEGVVQAEEVTASGITVRSYAVCDGPESVCGPDVDGPIRRGHSHFALEVAQDGRSALFPMNMVDTGHAVTAVGDDAVLVVQEPPTGADLGAAGYRLLRADGTERRLRSLIDDPVPAVPGPGAVTVNFEPGGSEGTTHPFVLDEGAGTLRPMALARSAEDRDRVLRDLGAWWPEAGLSWGPNPDESLWFVYHDCTVHWGTGEFYGDGGSYREHKLGCGEGFDGAFGEDDFTYLRENMFPAGWLRPGRMAAIENREGRLLLHVSLDLGASWQRIPITDEAAIPDTLRQLG